MEIVKQLQKEYSLFASLATFFLIEHFKPLLLQSTSGTLLGLAILFVVIVYAAMSVSYHAEMLAEKFGEPYGTLILTMAAVIVEIVMISIMMLHTHNPVLARDTIYSAIMLDINGLLGFAAIMGGIKYGEQAYNIDSTNSYLSMLLVAIGVAMVLPEFIDTAHHQQFMFFNVVIFLLLYLIFTRVQLKSHRYFFEYIPIENEAEETQQHHHTPHEIHGWYHALNLIVSIIMIGILSELLSLFMDDTLKDFALPLAIGAVIVALISAAPELITAVRAAIDNRMQTVINIALGASLVTVLLTIPAVIVISSLMGLELNLSLTPLQTMLIALTLLVSMVNFNDGETNALEGFLHVVLFIVFVFLLFI